MLSDCTRLLLSVVSPLVRAVSCLERQALAQSPSDAGPAQVASQDVEFQPSWSTEQALPAQDRGYAAWSFLFAAAVVEAVTWSIPFSFGILIGDYLQLPEIASQPNASTLIPLIGTLSSGIMYCSGSFHSVRSINTINPNLNDEF
ncbi:hypothetical protein J3R83DRAFT_10670 [Lanmaoa asiatica]|nr:hypothetical protein J3R83DRAFT_10670 [Lanmaoa asiatica]